MHISTRTGRTGAFVFLAAVATAIFSVATAETVKTVNGVDIDSALVDMYLQSRTQKPANQATPAERDAAMQELTDIYLLTTQPMAKTLENDPAIKAKIELQARGVLAQAVAEDFFAKNSSTEEEILAEYEIQKTATPALQFKARHILVESQAVAADLITELDEGADFSELAKTNSNGPTGPNGGDLGWFSPEQMVKPFSDALATLEDGAHTSAPVQTQFGWHVILREDSRNNQPPTLESVRDVIEQRIEQMKFQGYLELLRSGELESG